MILNKINLNLNLKGLLALARTVQNGFQCFLSSRTQTHAEGLGLEAYDV